METRKACLAEQPMEDVAHLVEERHDVAVLHERGRCRSRLCEVRDHRRKRV